MARVIRQDDEWTERQWSWIFREMARPAGTRPRLRWDGRAGGGKRGLRGVCLDAGRSNPTVQSYCVHSVLDCKACFWIRRFAFDPSFLCDFLQVSFIRNPSCEGYFDGKDIFPMYISRRLHIIPCCLLVLCGRTQRRLGSR